MLILVPQKDYGQIVYANSYNPNEGDGSAENPYRSLQTAVNYCQTLDPGEMKRIIVANSSEFDEDITIDLETWGIGSIIGDGPWWIGDGAGTAFASTTPRNLTILHGTTALPLTKRATLVIGTTLESETSSTHSSYSGGLDISGKVIVSQPGAATTIQLYFHNVKIRGVSGNSMAFSGAAAKNLFMRNSYLMGTLTDADNGLSINVLSTTQTDGLISANLIARVSMSEIKAGWTVQNAPNTTFLPPAGIYSSTLTGTFTGPALSLWLDLESKYWFDTNSATLGGSASIKILGSDVVAAGVSGLMSGADKTKLDGIEAGAEVNVNADWNAVSGDAQILNKPSIGGDALSSATSADNQVARYDGANNKTIQASPVTISDTGTVNIPTGQTYDVNGTPHTHAGLGDTLSSATSADNQITRYDGTNNKTVQASLATVDDAGTVNIPTGQTYNINGVPHTHAGGSGDVVGPSSATDNAIVRFDTATGKLVQNSGITISDADVLTLNPTSAQAPIVLGANGLGKRMPGFIAGQDPKYLSWFFDDLFALPTTSSYPLVVSNTGTGAAWTFPAPVDATMVGMLQGATGTTASGGASVISNSAVVLGTNPYTVEWRVRLPALSTASQRFTLKCGLADSTGAAVPTDGVEFEYNDNVNSGNWLLVATSNTIRTTANAASGPAANTAYRLKIVINEGATLATFYVNDTSVGTISSGIPSGTARATALRVGILSAVGTTTKLVLVDYVNGYCERTLT